MLHWIMESDSKFKMTLFSPFYLDLKYISVSRIFCPVWHERTSLDVCGCFSHLLFNKYMLRDSLENLMALAGM